MTTTATRRRRGDQTAFLRVRLSEKEKAALSRRAKQAGVTVSAVVREALRLSA